MRESAPYVGLAVAGIGVLWYAAIELRFDGVAAVFDLLQGAGLLLAAVGWVYASAGRGRGLLVAGLSMGVFSAVRGLPGLLDGDTARTALAGATGVLGAVLVSAAGVAWALSERSAGVSLAAARVGALLHGASGGLWMLGNVVPVGRWLPGNVLTLVGFVLFAATAAEPRRAVRDDEVRGRESAIRAGLDRLMTARRP